jgi:hypothetical protein
VLWPLAPRGHAPLRSLAEASEVVCCGSSVAARHRGAEEEIFLTIFCKYFLIRCLLSARSGSDIVKQVLGDESGRPAVLLNRQRSTLS